MKRSTAEAFSALGPVILPDMARRRGHQKGYLYAENGLYKLRWYEESIDANGQPRQRRSKPYIVGRAEGAGKLSLKQARSIQAAKMIEVNRGGSTTAVTVRQFIEKRFRTGYLSGLTANGKKALEDVLKHVDPAFGDFTLPEVKAPHVVAWLQAKADKGYSANYVRHMRNAVHLIFEYAAQCGIYEGRNPAQKLKIPQSAREAQRTQPYTLDDLRIILPLLDSPLWEMFVLGATTSMHAAELAGLRIEHVNLGDRPRQVQDRIVPAGSLYACESLAKGHRTGGKTKNRKRVLPIPEMLHDKIRKLIGDRPGSDPVFFMPRSLKTQGRVCCIDTGNISARTFKPIEERLRKQGIHIDICWHRLRATNATLTGQMLMDDETRRAMMGHGSIEMTRRYEDEHDKMRAAANAIAARLFEVEKSPDVVM